MDNYIYFSLEKAQTFLPAGFSHTSVKIDHADSGERRAANDRIYTQIN